MPALQVARSADKEFTFGQTAAREVPHQPAFRRKHWREPYSPCARYAPGKQVPEGLLGVRSADAIFPKRRNIQNTERLTRGDALVANARKGVGPTQRGTFSCRRASGREKQRYFLAKTHAEDRVRCLQFSVNGRCLIRPAGRPYFVGIGNLKPLGVE